MAALVIRGGEVVTAGDRFFADVLCVDGKIVAVGKDVEAPAGAKVLDASGRLVLPGGVDAHTHMELPFMGTVSADDFFSGTAAGVAGGTTSIVDFIIPARNQSLIEARDVWFENAKKSVADYGFHMAVTWFSDQVQRDMGRVFHDNGITSFKTFMAYTGAIGVDDAELIEVLETAQTLGALVTVHCEHGLAVQKLQQKLLAQGKTGPMFHAESRPSWIEGEATNRAIVLARCAGEPIYIVHLTCKEALEAVYTARKNGQVVFAETCPQYLLLDDSVYRNEDFATAAQYVMSPPIRPKGHQEALWSALAAGIIQTVATDHCPFRTDQKLMGKDDFSRIPNGAAGIQDRMALMYTYGVRTGRLSLEQMVDVCCTRPAKIFNLYPRKGALRPGADADVVLFDPEKSGRISGKNQLHRLDKSIFEGFELKGGVTHTVLKGEIAWADGKLNVTRGAGRYLNRRNAA